MFTREPFPSQFYRLKNLEVHCNNDQSIQHSSLSEKESPKLPELSFDRLQLNNQECTGLQRRNSGRFVAREAILDEEYWTAAWLRAEAHWESLSYMRHVDSYQRKYAEEVKKEDKNVKRTVLNSIVGTLDLSIKQFMQGETHPGEIKNLSAVLACQDPPCCETGMKHLFVHVNAGNKPARDLYKKAGFQIAEEAASPMSKDQRILMSMEL